MKKITAIGTLSVAFLATVALINCGGPKTCHISFRDRGGNAGGYDGKVGDVIDYEPATPENYKEEHYWWNFDGWYDGDTKFVKGETKITGDQTFTSKYIKGDAVKYTATFHDDGSDKTVDFTVENATKITTPEITHKADEGYTAYWTDQDLHMFSPNSSADFSSYLGNNPEFHPVDVANPHTITLMVNGTEEDVINSTFGELILDEVPTTEEYYERIDGGDHYNHYFTGKWTKTEGGTDYVGETETLGDEDITIYAEFKKDDKDPIYYDINFYNGKELVDSQEIYCNDGESEVLSITAPKISEDEIVGHTWKWVANDGAGACGSQEDIEFKDPEVSTNADLTLPIASYNFYLTDVKNTYTITYNANGGTMAGEVTTKTVTFGEEYTLDGVSNGVFDLEKWTYVNEDGDTVELPTSGTWNIPSNVDIKANWWISFENEAATTSAVVSNKSSNAVDLTVVDGGSLGTGKALKYTINSEDDGGIQIAKTLMEKMFADSNVVGINFDAKSSLRGNNWRHRSYIDTGVINKIYEQGNVNFGVETHWKTFQYLKKYYEADYSDAQVGNTYTIWSGNNSEGREFYIDNIKPVYKNIDILGFEAGAYINKNTADPIDNSDWRTGFDDASAGSQAILLEGNQSDTTRYSDSLEHSIVSEGNTSWKINKTGNYIKIKINKNIFMSGLSDDTIVTVDLYSTIALNSNPKVAILTGPDGKELGGEGYAHPAGIWVTYKFTVSQFTGNPWAQVFNIGGSPNPTIYIDNIVIHA